MEQLIIAGLQTLLNNSPIVACLVVGIMYLERADERKDARIEELINGLNKERIDRIAILEHHVTECNQQHAVSQQRYQDLLLKVARLDQIEQATHERQRSITQRVPTRSPS